jgi:chromosome segregation ATPase
MIQHASEQAAQSAEERAADIQEDADAIAEAGRAAEVLAADLQAKLQEAQQLITARERALEDVQTAAGVESKNAQERLQALQTQLSDERSRADQAVQSVAKAEVRLELIPGLQAEIERLKPYEQQAAVLTANLNSSRETAEDLKTRLAESLEDAKSTHEQLERVRISEQSLQAKLDAAVREVESLTILLSEVKTDLTVTKTELKEVREDLKKSLSRAQVQPKKGDTSKA